MYLLTGGQLSLEKLHHILKILQAHLVRNCWSILDGISLKIMNFEHIFHILASKTFLQPEAGHRASWSTQRERYR